MVDRLSEVEAENTELKKKVESLEAQLAIKSLERINAELRTTIANLESRPK